MSCFYNGGVTKLYFFNFPKNINKLLNKHNNTNNSTAINSSNLTLCGALWWSIGAPAMASALALCSKWL